MSQVKKSITYGIAYNHQISGDINPLSHYDWRILSHNHDHPFLGSLHGHPYTPAQAIPSQSMLGVGEQLQFYHECLSRCLLHTLSSSVILNMGLWVRTAAAVGHQVPSLPPVQKGHGGQRSARRRRVGAERCALGNWRCVLFHKKVKLVYNGNCNCDILNLGVSSAGEPKGVIRAAG